MKLRLTILGLMAAVLFVAVGIAALRSASDLVDSVAFSSACVILLLATLLAVLSGKPRRAWWVGFALFGWAYLVASQVPQVEPRLLTTRVLDRVGPALFPTRTIDVTLETDAAARAPFFRSDGASKPGVVLGVEGTSGRLYATLGGVPGPFRPVGHSLLAVALGIVGATLGMILYGKDECRRP